MGEDSLHKSHEIFEDHHMVSFSSYSLLPKVLHDILASYEFIAKETGSSTHNPQGLQILANEQHIKDLLLLYEDKPFLPLADSMNLINLTGIPILPLYHIFEEEEIDHVARKVSFPLVAKIASENVNHKTEVGGVIPHIYSIEQLKKAYKQLSKIAKKDGCYVQKMVSGYELFMGAKRDSVFGPVIVFGLGGIYAELMKEVVEFVYPFPFEALQKRMMYTKMEPLLKGFRNSPPLPLRDIYSTAMKLGYLLSRFEQIDSIDLNPLFVSGKSIYAVDSRVILNTH
jgi:acyl-CoA synthetase (NDP forming)